MISRSLIEQTKGRWREFRREPSAMLWVVLMPLLWMVLLGFAFSNPPQERFGLAIEPLPQVATTFQSSALEALQDAPQFKIIDADKSLRTKVFQRGEAVLGIRLNENDIDYFYDRNNPESRRALSLVDETVQKSAGRVDAVVKRVSLQETPGSRYIDFLIPGLLGLSIMTSSLFGVGLTIVSNRRENLLKRYLATPMPPRHYLISHIFGRMMVLSVEFATILLSGWLIFRFEVSGSFFAFMLLAILGAAAFTSLALLCAARTKSVPMMAGLINLICVPLIFMSGVFFSKTNFPDWMHGIISLLPLTALNDGLRKIALQGLSLTDLSLEISVLVAMTLICTVLTQKMFRWY